MLFISHVIAARSDSDVAISSLAYLNAMGLPRRPYALSPATPRNDKVG